MTGSCSRRPQPKPTTSVVSEDEHDEVFESCECSAILPSHDVQIGSSGSRAEKATESEESTFRLRLRKYCFGECENSKIEHPSGEELVVSAKKIRTCEKSTPQVLCHLSQDSLTTTMESSPEKLTVESEGTREFKPSTSRSEVLYIYSEESENSEIESRPGSRPLASEPFTRNRKVKKSTPRTKIRQYHSHYVQWGFVETSEDNKPAALCVLRLKVLKKSSMAPANSSRHLHLNHPQEENRPKSHFELAAKTLAQTQQKLPYERTLKRDELSLRLSYLIGRAGKAHIIGDGLIKPCLIEAASCLFGGKHVESMQMIPLSNGTVSRRIRDVSSWIETKVCDELRSASHWALQIDESTDVSGLSIMLAFVRYRHQFEICEELLLCRPVGTHSTGESTFNLIDTYLEDNQRSWQGCVNVCTDGAGAITGPEKGFVTRVKRVSPRTSSSHCIIHREALAARNIPRSLKTIPDEAVKIVNFIKSRPLRTRVFADTCDEIGSVHKSLLLHTENR